MHSINFAGIGLLTGGGYGHSGLLPIFTLDEGGVRPARGPSPVRIC